MGREAELKRLKEAKVKSLSEQHLEQSTGGNYVESWRKDSREEGSERRGQDGLSRWRREGALRRDAGQRDVQGVLSGGFATLCGVNLGASSRALQGECTLLSQIFWVTARVCG